MLLFGGPAEWTKESPQCCRAFFHVFALTVFDDEINLRGIVSFKGRKLNSWLNFMINQEQFW